MNRKKLFFAGGIGNSIEVFEAIVYAFLQPFITQTFFPINYRNNDFLFFLTIILPFLARPLGALFFGIIGDLKGRKTVLVISMAVSGISCCLMALIPSFQSIGNASFLLILLFRFLFGIAMSGEYNNSFLYLAEHSAPQSRGYILSWAAFGVSLGIFLATLIAWSFSHLIAANILPLWTFRIIFLFSAISLYIGYITRKELAETADFFITYPAFAKHKAFAIYHLAKKGISERILQSLKIILLSGFGTHITYSLLLYAPFHLARYNTNFTSFKDAILLITLSSCIAAMLIPLFGKLSDLIGRKFLLIISLTILTMLYLLFFSIADNASYEQLSYFYFILGIFNAIYFSLAPAEIINSLPNKARSTVNGLLYGIPAIVFGALSLPYFQTQIENYPNSPIFILLITIPSLLFLSLNKKELFKPSHEYMYSLEKIKVS